MTTFAGYVTIATSSYDTWRAATLGNQYDVDGYPTAQPYQCWDYTAEFWWNLGFPQGYPTLAGTHSAYGAWDDRVVNAGDKFDLIYFKNQIKRGDVIVYDQFPGNEFGHIGFADEDYNGTNNIQLLSQNNDHNYVTVHNYDLSHFRGAFRYIGWESGPIDRTKHRFPWVLYAKKLRNK